MNVIQKSEAIKDGLRKGFQDGSSKIAKRKCYGYEVSSDGELEINPDEAKVVSWIFERYLAGDSLGKINCCWSGKAGHPLSHWQIKVNTSRQQSDCFSLSGISLSS